MPRYYFHLRNDHILDDEEGTELADDQAAQERGFSFGLSMAAASIIETKKLDLNHRIEVKNEAGELVCRIEFRDVVNVTS